MATLQKWTDSADGLLAAINDSGYLGVGILEALRPIHVVTSATGQTPAFSSAHLVIERNADTGIEILAKNDATSQIAFTDGAGAWGRIHYPHTTDRMHISTGGLNRAIFDNADALYFGRDVLSATPVDASINGAGSSGTDIAGGDLALAGGRSTGNAVPGTVKIDVGDPEASGTLLQTLATKLTIGPDSVVHTNASGRARLVANGQATSNGELILSEDVAGENARSGAAIIYEGTANQLQIITGDLAVGEDLVADGTVRMVMDRDTGFIGVGTESPAEIVDIRTAAGQIQLIMADENADATVKHARFGLPHYTNAEEPLSISFAESTATENIVAVGGGTSTMNAATEVRIYTAANQTTTVGSQRLTVDSGGNLLVGTNSPTGTNGKVLAFGDNGGDPTPAGGSAGVFAKDVTGTVELFAVDDAANVTQLSPHDPETGEWIFTSHNTRTGRKFRVRMEELMKRLADKFPEDFADLIEHGPVAR